MPSARLIAQISSVEMLRRKMFSMFMEHLLNFKKAK
jgi:hypothetical protein